ncbi:MAG: serine hydrolase domain-containing protein, partial [Anaerolineae bacterium]
PVRSQSGVDPQALEAFADALFTEQLPRRNIPGAVLVVVQDGEVVLAKGYGFSDLETQTPFSAETQVRIGSVSKLFVATAVMQLVEQGRLTLDADVNRYLTTFKIDKAYPQPVTIAHLLTHTAGFDMAYGDFNFDPAKVQPLGTYLKTHYSGRINPPGEIIAYSNYGYALLGYIVEQVSGMPFDQYVQEYILTPLGMTHSRYFYSPPAPEGLATGYSYLSGGRAPQSPDYDSEYPGGGLVSTGADMARFMLAYLGDGCYEDACILQPATVAMMQQQQATNHPQLSGHGYAWFEGFQNGQRILGHAGSALGFGNNLELRPEANVGYFLSFNLECLASSACDLISNFREQFADRFFPGEAAPLPAFTPETDVSRLIGDYRFIWYPHRTVEKIRVLEQPDVHVTSGTRGIRVNDTDYVEVAPLLFQAVDGDARLAFRADAQGQITYLFHPSAYERLAWYETTALNNWLFNAWGWLWGVIVLIWPVMALVRRWRKVPSLSVVARWALWLTIAVAALHIAFLLSLQQLFWSSRNTMIILLCLPLLAMLLTFGLAGLTVRLWWRKDDTIVGRIYLAAVTVNALAFLLFLQQWNFLGFHLPGK